MSMGAATEAVESSYADGADYGQTNTQEINIDEGDLIKNDGSYLYIVIDGVVKIVETKDKGLRVVSTINTEESIYDLYVQGDFLVILSESYKFDRSADTEAPYQMSYMDGYYKYGEHSTKISIYDITDRTNPKLMNTLTQDGEYQSSRINDGYLYTFSKYYVNTGNVERDKIETFVPMVGDACVGVEDIMVSDRKSVV